MASAMTVLAYGGMSYEDAYKNARQYDHLQDAVKWGTELIKAHVSANVFYCQVGNGDIDHHSVLKRLLNENNSFRYGVHIFSPKKPKGNGVHIQSNPEK